MNASRSFRAVLFTAIVLAGGFLFAGCVGTVTPPIVASPGPSLDGGELNSGLVRTVQQGPVLYRYLTPQAHDRYVALVKKYDGGFLGIGANYQRGVALEPDGTWQFDPQAMEHFAALAIKNRSGIAP